MSFAEIIGQKRIINLLRRALAQEASAAQLYLYRDGGNWQTTYGSHPRQSGEL